MQSFSQIIDTLGGPSEAARKLGTSQQNAWQMKDRNSIPPKYWPRIIETIDGVSLSQLATLAAKRSRGDAA